MSLKVIILICVGIIVLRSLIYFLKKFLAFVFACTFLIFTTLFFYVILQLK
ncbi:hypothetical protein KAU39_03650 [bacterium]|nr:hypothetical protein [bacterium]